MYPDVGSFWGGVAHALNPMTGLKAGYNILSNPLHPLRGIQQAAGQFTGKNWGHGGGGGGGPPGPQTRALQNFGSRAMQPNQPDPSQQGDPSQGGGMPPGYPPFDPSQYAPPQSGYQPPPYTPPQYPQQYQQQYQAPPQAAPQYADPASYGPDPTGWEASYGSGQPDDWS